MQLKLLIDFICFLIAKSVIGKLIFILFGNCEISQHWSSIHSNRHTYNWILFIELYFLF